MSAINIPSLKGKVSDEEWQQREHLAAAYRIFAHYGWDDLIYTHLSARVPGPEHHFLINPLGFMFEEITASSLIKIDLEGNKVIDSPFMVNKAGFVIHSAVHAAAEDANCVMHLHTDYGIAASALKDGIQPISQSSIIGSASLAYHEFEGLAVREDEKERLVASLGNKKMMMLRNHGTMTVGETVGQAFEAMFFLEKACRLQVLTQSCGSENIHFPSEEAITNTLNDLRTVAGANGADLLTWPAILRKLDRMDPSFRD